MIRVGVIGALGKMGSEVCRAVQADPETVLVAAIDVQGRGQPIAGDRNGTIRVSDELDLLSQAEADVAVDFTHPDAVMSNLRWYIRHALDAVVGTTGMTEEHHAEIRRLLEEEGSESNVFLAPNFALGAVLMMRFAVEAAKYLPDVEIIELHHDRKAEAPSGTAMRTAAEIAEVRGDRAPAPVTELAEGARGGTVHGIAVHSIRLPGLVAHQEVIFGGPGQTLSIRHDSTDRAGFMPGVLLAVKAIRSRPGLTIGLENLL